MLNKVLKNTIKIKEIIKKQSKNERNNLKNTMKMKEIIK